MDLITFQHFVRQWGNGYLHAEYCERGFLLKKKAPLALSQRKLALE